MEVACPHCRAEVAAGTFCERCGARLEKTCLSCNSLNRITARFCADCGIAFEPANLTAVRRPVEASDLQQKQITVLFVDICGSTELVARLDAEDAHQALGRVIDRIGDAMRRFGGLVIRQMGDGAMVLFGAPAAAEDHAARACFAALAALDAVATIEGGAVPVRIGICSGPVILRRTGRDDEDYDVAGLTAHVAARLEQAAEPGTILMAPQTAALVIGIAELEPIGKLDLKGIAEPMPAFRLLGAVDRPSWTVRSGYAAQLSAFVGRELELAALSRALAGARAGHTHAVALVADAGVGKSRLLHEFLLHMLPSDWHVIRAEPTAQTTASPYFLLTALLRQLAGGSDANSTADIAAGLPSAIAALGIDVDATPLLVHLDSDAEMVDVGGGDPAQRRGRLVQALRPILRRYAELHPLVLVIEDFHWLDVSSAELLHELLIGFDAPFLLLLATRPERRPAWSDVEASNFQEIDLGHLTAIEADQLLCDVLGSSEDLAPLRELIVTRAEGTPLFLEEFARSLHESGAIAKGAPSLTSVVIPATVQSILAARIDRLSPLHRRILQLAAVIGRDVPASLLGTLADVQDSTLTQAMMALRIAGFTVEYSLVTGTVQRFSHALTQAVAYDSLLRSERRILHLRVLRALEAQLPGGRDSIIDQLTHHAVCSESWAAAARHAVMAGERASRQSAMVEARGYFELALDALRHEPVNQANLALGIDARLGLRGVIAAFLDDTEMLAYLQQHLDEANKLAEQAGDRLSFARVCISRGALLSHWGDLLGATKLSRTALGLMNAEGDYVGIVSGAFALAQSLWYSGDLAEARDVLRVNLPFARDRRGQTRNITTFVLPAVGFFSYLARIESDLGDTAAGFEILAEIRGIIGNSGYAFDDILLKSTESTLLLADGRTTLAIDKLEAAMRTARAQNIEWHIPVLACLLGQAYVLTGRHGDARMLLESACTFADRNHHLAKRLMCGPALITALAGAANPDLEAANVLAKRTLSEAMARGYRPIVVQTLIAEAKLRLLDGNPAEAKAALETAIELADRLGLVHSAITARNAIDALQPPSRQIAPYSGAR